jgi:hypothetical protein
MMKRLGQAALVLAVIATASQNVLAQGRGGFGGGGNLGFLLNQASVQEELKLSAEQKQKAAGEMEKLMGEFASLQGLDREQRTAKMAEINKASEKSASAFLDADQLKRAKQISLQLQYLQAFMNPEVADSLKLTGEQNEKLQSLQSGVRQEIQELFQGGFSEEARAKAQTLNKAAMEKAAALLTADQKTKWGELTGKPFTGEIVFRRPGQ